MSRDPALVKVNNQYNMCHLSSFDNKWYVGLLVLSNTH